MKMLRLFAAAALALGSVSAPVVPAMADPVTPPGQDGTNAELLDFCYTILASGDYGDALNFGRCMGFNDTSIEGLATQTCMALRGQDLLADHGFDSFSDCVTTLQQLY